MNEFNGKMNKILNFELTFFSIAITLTELALTIMLKKHIGISLILIQISAVFSCIIFKDQLRKNNILKLLEEEEELAGRLYYSGLLKSECKENLSIEVFMIVLVLIIFCILPIF